MIKFFSKIRTKFITIFLFLIATISLFIFIFFPAELEKQGYKAIADKANSLIEIIAFSVSPAIFFDDIESINIIAESAKQDEDLVYLVINDVSGRILFSFNKNKKLDQKSRNPESDVFMIEHSVFINNLEIGHIKLGLSLENLRKQVSGSRKITALASIIIFLVGTVSFFIISMIITKPLNQMVKTVELISKGDLTHRVDISSQYEVGQLGLAFNTMLDRLESAYTELINANQTLELRVKERTSELQHEINERILAEKALKESEEKYRILVENANEAIFIIQNEMIKYTNPKAINILGYPQDTLLLDNLLNFIHPEDRDIMTEEIIKDPNNKKNNRNHIIRILDKAGNTKWLEVSRLVITWEESPAILILAYDITEKRRLEDEALKAQKLESIALLAGGIAHDFNNYLTGIDGNITLAKMLTKSDDKAYERLSEAEKALKRASNLTKQLLTFSKGGMPVLKATSIVDLLKESVSFVLSGSNVRCEFSIPDNIWNVNVDEGQINQVINNLVINAMQSMPNGGIINITVENIIIKEKEAISLEPGNYVKVSIKDHGIGIPDENINKIFDPFFTTKINGTGLGLSITYSIIKKHNGYITVESKLGAGTTFHFYLPAILEKVQSKEKSIAEETIKFGKGKILVMDDEEIIRELAYEMLSSLGYDVTTVKDGSQAIDYYKKAIELNEPYDLVIMDLTIPGGMGGNETMKNLLKIDPDIIAVVSSGYSNDPIMANFKEYGFRGIIPKPYKMMEVSDILHKLIVSK